jgi:hypothetical protein
MLKKYSKYIFIGLIILLSLGYLIWGGSVSGVFRGILSGNTQSKITDGISLKVGSKEYVLKYVNDEKGIDFLRRLMKENPDNFSFATKSYSFGEMLLTINSKQADETKEFWELKVNGKQSEVGISDLVLKNGDVLEFNLVGINK